MTTTDVMMMGWLSPRALAAGSLGFNLYMPLFLFGVGVIGAVAPIAAHAIGAGAAGGGALRRVAQQAFIAAMLICVPVWLVLANASALLKAFGEPPELADMAGVYMHGLQWALAPGLLYFGLRSIFAALDRTTPILVAALLACAFNAGANYVLIFGHFGFPALGVFGSGLATTLSQSLMFLWLALASFLDPRLRAHRLFALPLRFDGAGLGQILRLGVPIGATITAEISTFALVALAMGLISAEAIEAHAIVLQIAATAFMVPLGVGQAATVRVGHAFGARDVAGIARAGWTAFGVTMAYVALSAATMFLAPRLLISAFIAPEAPANLGIAALAYSFLRIAALFQVFDGGQAALANMLRGVHDSRWPMALALAGYWCVGAPFGLALGFLTPLRGLGLWIGLATGLAVVSALLLARWLGKLRRGFFETGAEAREPALSPPPQGDPP